MPDGKTYFAGTFALQSGGVGLCCGAGALVFSLVTLARWRAGVPRIETHYCIVVSFPRWLTKFWLTRSWRHSFPKYLFFEPKPVVSANAVGKLTHTFLNAESADVER